MNQRLYAFPVAAFIGVLPLASLVHVQAASATLDGPVLDESSAVVPGASPGRYRVTEERDGFRIAEMAAFDLNVWDNVAVRLVLRVPRVGESVTVPADAPVRASPAVSTVVDRTFVENVPPSGRSFQTLIMLAPGVVAAATTFDDQGQFSVTGYFPILR